MASSPEFPDERELQEVVLEERLSEMPIGEEERQSLTPKHTQPSGHVGLAAEEEEIEPQGQIESTDKPRDRWSSRITFLLAVRTTLVVG